MKNRMLMFALGLMLSPALSAAPAGKQVLKKLDDQSFAAFTQKKGAHLDLRVKKGTNLVTAMRTYTGKLSGKFSSKRLGITRVSATRALIPYSALSPPFQKAWIQAMWPKDKLSGGFWQHTVTYNGHETLWTLSQIFTETGQNHRAIRRASGLRSDRIHKGKRIKIPSSLLRKGLLPAEIKSLPKPEDPVIADSTPLVEEVEITGQTSPVPLEADQPPANNSPGTSTSAEDEPPPGENTNAQEPASDGMVEVDENNQGQSSPTAGNNLDPNQVLALLEADANLQKQRRDLRFGTDRKGKYAEYRLKRGEAIYSAVVVKYCGLVRAEDVRRVASEIIQRNNIVDETDLPVNMPIRIPYDFLEPEFREVDDPELLAYLRNLKEVSEVETAIVSRNLEGVHLILDAGHGGRDPGTIYRNQVWEDDYVYDIICRIRERLLRESGATVHTTILDPSVNYKVQNVAQFRLDQDEILLTTPSYPLKARNASKAGVNLRWMKSNYVYESLIKKGVQPENVIFTSFHADSLHSSIRGSMVYIPDARVYPRSLPNIGSLRQYREHKINRRGFTRAHMRQSQARSMKLAQNYVSEIKNRKLRVHKQKPIRTLIYRNPNRPFVPAVVKYNRVPTRALIEVCNLNNAKDRALMRKPTFRQAVADAYVEAVYKSYGIAVTRLSSTARTSSGK